MSWSCEVCCCSTGEPHDAGLHAEEGSSNVVKAISELTAKVSELIELIKKKEGLQ